MKNRVWTAILALALTTAITNAHATSDEPKTKKETVTDMTEAQKTARLEEINNRVNEIKSMNKSSLTRSEKKDLKKELKAMNKEARTMKGGVYLSVGAIIIIILVLILIL